MVDTRGQYTNRFISASRSVGRSVGLAMNNDDVSWTCPERIISVAAPSPAPRFTGKLPIGDRLHYAPTGRRTRLPVAVVARQFVVRMTFWAVIFAPWTDWLRSERRDMRRIAHWSCRAAVASARPMICAECTTVDKLQSGINAPQRSRRRVNEHLSCCTEIARRFVL